MSVASSSQNPSGGDSYARAVQFPYSYSAADSSYLPPMGPQYPLYQTPRAAHDDRGRQKKFIESSAQRRGRVEFIRRREWTHRITDWVNQYASPSPKLGTTYTWDHLLRYVDDDDYAASAPDTLDDPDDAEPYIIYTASPRPRPSDTPSPSPSLSSVSSSSSCSSATATAASSSPTFLPPAPRVRRRPHEIPRSRHSSLSSISEEDEYAHPRPLY
ncbi:hypothetical protein SCP_1004100 [Sparassis crispa]|uniref:Uncharacterized protein n=1 Tax=Sparassis crispa TaxID=139825 RepID=A0A401GY87_9APHY|nr:hypothetical protein SCP_1004100 [Sparassis crispa]GBE87163.1 hypothetical protein SCP_1004100 [Sparassis crispa]